MKHARSSGWLELIFGILLIILGTYTILNPLNSLEAFAVVYGVFAIFTGIVDVALYSAIEVKTSAGTVSLFSGILSILAGILILFWPNAGVGVMTILFPLWFIFHCISRLCNLKITRILGGRSTYYITMIINIIGLILGILILFSPLISALAIAYLIGIYLAVLGVGSLFIAFAMLSSR